MVQFSSESVTIRGGILYFSRARERARGWAGTLGCSHLNFSGGAGSGRAPANFEKAQIFFCADRKAFDKIGCRRSLRVAQNLKNCKIR